MYLRGLLSLALSLLFHFLLFIFLFADMSIFPVQSAPLEHRIMATVVLVPLKETKVPEAQNFDVPSDSEKMQTIKEENKVSEIREVVPEVTPKVEPQKNIVKKQVKPVEKAEPKSNPIENSTNEVHEINTDRNKTHTSNEGSDFLSPAVNSALPKNSGADNDALSSGRAFTIAEVDSVIIVNRVKPVYPPISRKRGEEGNVVLLARVESGKVVNVSIEVSSGIKALDSSALSAVGKWSFSHDTSVTVRIPVSFKLKD